MNSRYWLSHPSALRHRFRYWLWEKLNPDKPWLCPGTVRFLSRCLNKGMQGLEFGSGRSTMWFATQLGHLTSVEHDPAWYMRVKNGLSANKVANVDYRLVQLDHEQAEPERAAYAPVPRYVCVADAFADQSLDVVIVDGHYRNHCIRRSIPKIKAGGYLLVDDANMWRSIQDIPAPESWEIVEDGTNGLKRTLVWEAL
jgi:predicted O-methyltransferase YrrM